MRVIKKKAFKKSLTRSIQNSVARLQEAVLKNFASLLMLIIRNKLLYRRQHNGPNFDITYIGGVGCGAGGCSRKISVNYYKNSSQNTTI